ncbi:hypothetical protein PV08_05883 [Exophiala spinifera]|uniref:Extracellular membrane protein CFEM domain-containing protein n=1 Tax=Exophiala spinifera TaxID=91928 RepID=A0A0D2BA06_9EURO|nr:uncharacterized protein PV08_05883 [Exophiala spinifera]KIW15833.1 hypothetical protein PV08_05883 [Exophiala spinifera]
MSPEASLQMLRYALMPLLLGLARSQTSYESIYTLDAFSQQQSCVQSCFVGGYADIDCFSDVLGSALGCPNSPCSKTFAAVDNCYCRGDLQTAAYDFLSSCIDETCSVGDNAVNLANAASIYSGYCTQRGFTALAAQNTATTTTGSSDGDLQAAQPSSRTGSTSSPVATGSTGSSSSSPSSSASSSGTSPLTIALAVVGSVAGIAILAAGYAFLKIRQRRNVPYQGPVSLTPWLDNPSSQKMRFDGASTEIDVYPNESASQIGLPTNMGPSYPHYPVPPSAISSNRPGHNQSTVGPGFNYHRH